MKRNPLILLILSVFTFNGLSAQEVERFDAMNKNRDAVKKAYREVYLPAEQIENNWIHGKECDPGHLTQASLNARLIEINYFRNLCGLAPVTFTPENNRLAQAAANLMRANGTLNHHPPKTWKCYSEEGAQGASSCNLGYGGDLMSYMDDYGTSNRDCGHRMWILDSEKAEMGYGGAGSANAVFVFGSRFTPTRLPKYVTWPAAGFFPAELASSRWTFSIPGLYANYKNAQVKVSIGGKEVPLVYSQYTSYGDGGIAFELENFSDLVDENLDKRIQVKVSGIEIGMEVHAYGYEVVLFEAEKDDQIQLVVSGLKSDQSKAVANSGSDAKSQDTYAMEEEGDEDGDVEPELEIALADRTLVMASQLRDEEGLGNMLVETLAAALKIKVKYSDAYVALAQRISEIRKEKDPEDARMNAYVGKRVGELVTGRSCSQGAESPATAQPKYYFYEFKQLVPGGGKVTMGEIAEVLVKKCMENPAMRSYLLKNPTVRNAALGFAGKTVVRDGKSYFGLYVTLVIAPPAAA